MEEWDISFCSMDGILMDDSFKSQPIIQTMDCLTNKVNKIFSFKFGWAKTKSLLIKTLENCDLCTNDVNKYTFWDVEKPYTRNLVYNCKDYSILILCWSPGKESKIHNHPSDGCFVKTLRGCIRETRYKMEEDSNSLTLSQTRFYTEGQVSWMSDDLGLHKIGNPNKDTGSVSMHLYAPPYNICKVWSSVSSLLSEFELSKIGYFSVFGLRTPQLEGKPGQHAKVIQEIQNSADKIQIKFLKPSNSKAKFEHSNINTITNTTCSN